MIRLAKLAVVLSEAVWLLAGCGTRIRQLRQQVRDPRAGRPAGQVAVVFSDHYTVRLGGFERVHTFPIHKYEQAFRRLVSEGFLRPEDVFVPQPLTEQQLRLVHTEQYVSHMRSREGVADILHSPGINLIPRRLVSEGIVRSFLAASGGTVLAGRLALDHGIAINLAGGYNHASADRGHGFSMIADVPIAIRQLQADGRIRRAMIIDLDVHQGDGPALVFPPSTPDVYVFDMFEEQNNPKPKADEHYAIPLPRGLDDERYLKILADHLPRAIAEARPDIIFYVAGSDVHWADVLGHMRLTIAGIVRRDLYVVEQARQRGIPIAIVTGGGYSPASWRCIHGSARAILERYGRTDSRARAGARGETR